MNLALNLLLLFINIKCTVDSRLELSKILFILEVRGFINSK